MILQRCTTCDDEYSMALNELRIRETQLPPDIDGLSAAGERVTEMARVWEIASEARRAELTRELLRSVRMDTRGKSLRLDPWPEYAGLLHARREFVESSTPGWTEGQLTQRWLVLPAELGVAS